MLVCDVALIHRVHFVTVVVLGVTHWTEIDNRTSNQKSTFCQEQILAL